MNVKDLINEYGLITNKPPGWEQMLSVKDYLEFKRVSVEIPPIDVNTTNIQKDTRVSTNNISEQSGNLSGSNKQSTTHITPKPDNIPEKSELDMFKSLGE